MKYFEMNDMRVVYIDFRLKINLPQFLLIHPSAGFVYQAFTNEQRNLVVSRADSRNEPRYKLNLI